MYNFQPIGYHPQWPSYLVPYSSTGDGLKVLTLVMISLRLIYTAILKTKIINKELFWFVYFLRDDPEPNAAKWC